ncbi:MAG: xanthine dehydrogenase small subunit [Leptothrix ochracea]|uniref:xanthine dehydrogenase small subunit n=1 Tax=Leptothrix ochracea TaxID=735331 RepID=UPI0034E1CCA5
MNAPIRFIFRGQVVEAANTDPTRTLLQWLREDARTLGGTLGGMLGGGTLGTKEGCNEGDCGACTVIVAELEDGNVRLRTLNACIRFLPTLHGKALLTVEDLSPAPPTDSTQPPRLHPAQEALVRCHGSQCGFCTPGFAMSLALSFERQRLQGRCASRAELADDLAGNLCRCTGYRPILDAAEQMGHGQEDGSLPEGLALGPLQAQLEALRQDAPLDSPTWHAPRSLPELAELRLAHPQARLLAGGTDIGLWVNKQLRETGPLIHLGDVAELRQLRREDTGLHIGAAVTLEDAWQALVQHWPSLSEIHRRFAGPPVRHAGTLVGNLANGSPIGDAAPVLMALGAKLLLRRGTVQRELALDAFYVDYMQNRLEAGEFIEAVQVPLTTVRGYPTVRPESTSTVRAELVEAPERGSPSTGSGRTEKTGSSAQTEKTNSAPTEEAGPWHIRAWKISKRFDCDISALSAGMAIQLDAAGVVTGVKLAFGGMAAVVKRAAGTEAALLGQPWNEATLERALAALEADFTPLSDLRASASYRRAAARGLLMRLWLETRPDQPLPAAQLRVFEGTV